VEKKSSPGVNVFKVWDFVGLIINYVWNIRLCPAFDYGGTYFVRVEHTIKKVRVAYACRRLSSSIEYGV